MKTKPASTIVTVKFTVEFTRTLELTQNDKPSHYSNVEWAKQQIENVCQEAEMEVTGNSVECQYRIIDGDLPAEICDDEDSP